MDGVGAFDRETVQGSSRNDPPHRRNGSRTVLSSVCGDGTTPVQDNGVSSGSSFDLILR